MAKYTVTLSDAEDKALGHVAVSQQDWIETAVKNRCRKAIDEIVNAEVQKKLAVGESIPGSKEEIVLSADILTAKQINEQQQSENIPE